MKFISKYPILTLILLLVFNVVLTFFLFLVLADGILHYIVGFALNGPLLFFSLVFFVLTIIKYFNRKNKARFYTIIAFIFLSILNLFFYLFNVIVWIDLFDGKTNALLP
jgi:hypothetical protein